MKVINFIIPSSTSSCSVLSVTIMIMRRTLLSLAYTYSVLKKRHPSTTYVYSGVIRFFFPNGVSTFLKIANDGRGKKRPFDAATHKNTA